MNIYGISDEEMLAMREAADKAWRGISYRPYGQVIRQDVPVLPDQGFWGRVNNEQTELEAAVNHK